MKNTIRSQRSNQYLIRGRTVLATSVNSFIRKSALPLLVVLVFLLAGCTFSAKKLNSLQIGMTEEEVIHALGSPAAVAEHGDLKTLTYWFPRNPFTKGKILPRQLPHWVCLKEGRVEQFGKTERMYVLEAADGKQSAGHIK